MFDLSKKDHKGQIRQPHLGTSIQKRAFLSKNIALRETEAFPGREILGLLLLYRIAWSYRRPFAARGENDFHRPHGALAAGRTPGDVEAGKPKQGFLPGLLFGVVPFLFPRGIFEELPAECNLIPAAAIGQEAVMPDLDEPLRQHVKQESPDEFEGVKRHHLDLVVIGVVTPPEVYRIVFELHQPVVADRDPVRVSAEIIDYIPGLLEARLAAEILRDVDT